VIGSNAHSHGHPGDGPGPGSPRVWAPRARRPASPVHAAHIGAASRSGSRPRCWSWSGTSAAARNGPQARAHLRRCGGRSTSSHTCARSPRLGDVSGCDLRQATPHPGLSPVQADPPATNVLGWAQQERVREVLLPPGARGTPRRKLGLNNPLWLIARPNFFRSRLGGAADCARRLSGDAVNFSRTPHNRRQVAQLCGRFQGLFEGVRRRGKSGMNFGEYSAEVRPVRFDPSSDQRVLSSGASPHSLRHVPSCRERRRQRYTSDRCSFSETGPLRRAGRPAGRHRHDPRPHPKPRIRQRAPQASDCEGTIQRLTKSRFSACAVGQPNNARVRSISERRMSITRPTPASPPAASP
jgi:hypothetical protein